MTKPVDDPIVEEIRRVREAHAEAFDHDLKRITQDLQRLERESGRALVERAPRRPEERPKRSTA